MFQIASLDHVALTVRDQNISLGWYQLCIGNQFALTEAQLILATILPRYQSRFLPGANVVPEPLITLRPRGGLFMTIQRKGGQ